MTKIIGIETNHARFNFYMNEDKSIALHAISKIENKLVFDVLFPEQAKQLLDFLKHELTDEGLKK